MASVMSASESAFSDAEDDPVFPPGPGERKRLRSVEDMVKVLEGKRKRVVSPRQAEKQSKDKQQDFLKEIKEMIDSSIKSAFESLWEKIDRKVSSIETKIDKLEGQVFERDQVIDELQETVRSCQEHITGLEEQVEDLERNSRSSNLIFYSKQIGKREEGEDIQEKTINLINENFPAKSVTRRDFSAINRLSSENTVICAFSSKNLRNEIYEERLTLRRREVGVKERLYVSESLTKSKKGDFQQASWAEKGQQDLDCIHEERLSMLQDDERLFSHQDLLAAAVGPGDAAGPRCCFARRVAGGRAWARACGRSAAGRLGRELASGGGVLGWAGTSVLVRPWPGPRVGSVAGASGGGVLAAARCATSDLWPFRTSLVPVLRELSFRRAGVLLVGSIRSVSDGLEVNVRCLGL